MKNTFIQQFIIIFVAASSAIQLNASTVGWWDLEEGVDGTNITTALESGGNTAINGVGQGNPEYRTFSDFGGTRNAIQEGLTGPVRANNFMMSVNAINDEINIPNDAVLGTTGANESFTAEFFIYWDEEVNLSSPVYLERRVSNTDRWEIGFNHGNANNYGKINFYLDSQLKAGPGGDGRIFVDTDSGSGIPSEYTSGTPEIHGDGRQDESKRVWHHIAYVYDHTINKGTYYVDYSVANSFTAQLDIQNAGIDWGKTRGGADNSELFLDELRYSNTALLPDQMLRMVVIPETSSYAYLFGGLTLLMVFLRKHYS